MINGPSNLWSYTIKWKKF